MLHDRLNKLAVEKAEVFVLFHSDRFKGTLDLLETDGEDDQVWFHAAQQEDMKLSFRIDPIKIRRIEIDQAGAVALRYFVEIEVGYAGRLPFH